MKSKKLISFIAILFTLIHLLSIISLSTVGLSPEEKISSDLLAIMESSDNTDPIPVVIWMPDIEHASIEAESTAYRYRLINERISELSQQRNASVSFGTFKITADDDVQLNNEAVSEITNEYIVYKRQAHQSSYLTENSKKMNDIFSKKTLQSDFSICAANTYVSMYSPVLLSELTKSQIIKVCSSEHVSAINYNPQAQNFDNEPTNVASSDDDGRIPADLSDYSYNTASGIKVGMIEHGVPKNVNNSFICSNLYYDDALKDDQGTLIDQYANLHASQVASVLVGREDGIIPDAKLYCTSTKRDGGWQAGVEWLLSQGVSVINMSFAIENPASGYGVASAWLDHIAIQHSVHIIVAVGNVAPAKGYPETVISQGAYANNIIAVGGTVTDSDEVDSGSNYSVTRYKPDICAPFTVNVRYGAKEDENCTFHPLNMYWSVTNNKRGKGSGTSFSAPIVTAVVAQLCKMNSTLLTYQDALKSILLAGTNITDNVSGMGTLNNNAMQRKLGAGVLNLSNARYVLNNVRYYYSNFSASTGVGEEYARTIQVTSNDTFIRVALVWLNTVRLPNSSSHANQENFTSNTLEMLRLTIIGPNGTYWTSYDTTGNVQLLTFRPQELGGIGTYTIKVQRATDYNSKIYYSLAWY